MKKYVNVCFNGIVLKTVLAQGDKTLSIHKTVDGLNFPDSDRLFLEDIDGFRYKRTDFLNPDLIFEQI